MIVLRILRTDLFYVINNYLNNVRKILLRPFNRLSGMKEC